MHNIYNKKILTTNGTLIDNWFEEEELRKLTGEGRSIIGNSFKKMTFDPEVIHTNNNPRDNTYQRVIGEKEPTKDYSLTSNEYGQNNDEILKYTHPPLNAPDNKKKLNIYIKKSNLYGEEVEKCGNEFRSFESTNKSLHPPQPFINNIGLNFEEKGRKMEESKCFNEENKLIQEDIIKNPENYVPSFWINNINSSNIYRSFTKGINPWAKSSAFTQKVGHTKGAFQYYQNAFNEPILYDAKKEDKIDTKEKNLSYIHKHEKEVKTSVSEETIKKIFKGCSLRGWIGLRELKCYLRNLSGHRSDFINKNDFKYFFAKQAILLNDNDVDSIFEVYDVSKNNYINYIAFLNSINFVSDERKAKIESFKEQVKVQGQNYILFSHLITLFDMSNHPESMVFKKTVPDLEMEYKINWDNLKEDNRIKENDFKEFFYDISACVEKDEEFNQILKALGFKEN